jgi:hypothetical protein
MKSTEIAGPFIVMIAPVSLRSKSTCVSAPISLCSNFFFFFFERPNLIIHSANGGKGEGWHVEEYSVALLC